MNRVSISSSGDEVQVVSTILNKPRRKIAILAGGLRPRNPKSSSYQEDTSGSDLEVLEARPGSFYSRKSNIDRRTPGPSFVKPRKSTKNMDSQAKKRKLRNYAEELDILAVQIDSIPGTSPSDAAFKSELVEKRMYLLDKICRCKESGAGDRFSDSDEDNVTNDDKKGSKDDKKGTKDDENDEYEVEKIMDVKTDRSKRKFLIKWKGWDHADNTWEPEEHLDSCSEKIKEFFLRRREQNGHKCKDGEDDDFVAFESKKTKNKQEDGALIKAFEHEIEKFYESTGFPPMVDTPQRITEDKLESLKPRAWISNFALDDFIQILFDKIGPVHDGNRSPNTKVTFVPHSYFEVAFNSVQPPHPYVSESLFKYVYSNNLLASDVILVLTSTAAGQETSGSADHWMLGIIHKESQSIYLLDSIGDSAVRSETFLCLATIVHIMYEVENLKTPLADWSYIYSNDCLEQTNGFDCGLFVCLNVFAVLKGIRPGKVTSAYGRKFLYNVLKNGIVKLPQPKKDSKDLVKLDPDPTLKKLRHNTWSKLKSLKEVMDIECKSTNDLVFNLVK